MGAAEDILQGLPPMAASLSTEQLAELVRRIVRAEAGNTNAEEAFIFMDDVMKILGVKARKTVRMYVREMGLPAYPLGNDLRFKRAEVVAWLEARALKSGVHVSKAAERVKRAKEASGGGRI